MLFDEVPEQFLVSGPPDAFELDHIEVAECVKKLHLVEYVGGSAAHSCAEIASGLSEYNNGSAGHVFAGVVADAFYYGGCSAVSYAESLACDSVDEDFAAGRSVEQCVSDDYIFIRNEGRFGRFNYDDSSAAKSLAEIIIAVADEFQCYAGREECAKALASRAGEVDFESAIGQTVSTMFFYDSIAYDSAYGPVNVSNRHF